MYKRYFGLKRAPFSIAPDPRFLYMSPQHEEALAHLLYGIGSDGGFVLLTGEIGAGKTTIFRHILDTMSSDIATAYIINPTLSVAELLAAVCDDFGIKYPRKTTIKVLIDRINAFLLELHMKGRKAILIIEEAQNLQGVVLEQIRLLTNLETNERKLLQIILIGQPELRDRLSQPDMRQLSQRIVARYHIDALSKPDLISYVNHRIAVARGKRPAAANNGRRQTRKKSLGAKTKGDFAANAKAGPPTNKVAAPAPEDCGLFSKNALNSLYACSGGIPRLINLICDRALLGAFVQNRQIVSKETLVKAAAEVLGTPSPEAKGNWKFPLAAAVLICTFLGLVYLALNGSTQKAWPLWQAQSMGDSAQEKPEKNPRVVSRHSLPASPAPLSHAGSDNTTGIDLVPKTKPTSQP
ncbi:MAG: AAA family ATPase [Syntrophobacteraceae bacterium]|nr:AAA family ATPase [Syntrophobacteraceae bacterium]